MWWRESVGGAERERGERLAAAVDQALATLPLHLERAVREAFSLAENPRLEDVRPGALCEALALLSRPQAREILGMFL